MEHLLIILVRGLKYSYNVELLYPLDEFQTNWIFYRGNIKHKHHFYRVGNMIKVMFLLHVLSIKDPICLKLVKCFILPQQRPVLGSAHAPNFFSWSSAKKMLQENANWSPPKTVIAVTKVENEIYLPYLQLCGKAFFDMATLGLKIELHQPVAVVIRSQNLFVFLFLLLPGLGELLRFGVK